MSQTIHVLVCDDDPAFQLSVKRTLKGRFKCLSAYNGDEALAIIKNQTVDVLLLDIQMRSSDEGLKFIPKFLELEPDLAIIMSSSMTDFRTVREAMRLGAADYIVKDFDTDELMCALEQALERRTLLQHHKQQDFEVLASQNQHILIGNSPSMMELRKTVSKVRNTLTHVIITGDTGTGKELVARQIRNQLPNGTLAPFVAVDASTIQSSTAESVLFGHEKGAFTGADKSTKGIFEEANNGVVYFDEISNMPLDIQSKLLRVIQEKEVSRLGSSKTIQLDFRVICATNQNLESMVQQGKFKADLYQRLAVIPIQLSPLCERVGDIPQLIEHFVQKPSCSRQNLKFTESAIEVLKEYPWPGNVRELGNLIAYLATMVDDDTIDVADLPPRFRDAARQKTSATRSEFAPNSSQSFYEQVSEFENDLLTAEYKKMSGNITQLALALGMDRSHLYTKLKEFGIHPTRK